MRIQWFQNIVDGLRGKKRARIKVIPVSVVDMPAQEVDDLLTTFDHGEFKFNGRTRRYLANVNADRGVTEQTLSLLCRQFPTERGDVKVLNVGCGKKNQMSFLEVLGFEAYGVDFDIETDSDKVKFHDLNTQDDLPFERGSFDCVICQEIIEHVENPWLLLRKVKSALKVGGTLIVTTPNISSNRSKKIFTENNVGFYAYFDPANMWQHINPIPFWEMTHIATFNGFESVTLSGNNEYYVRYLPRTSLPAADLNKQVTIQNNDILHYVFRNLNSEIKLYSPIPTHNYVWPTTAK